jgi:hypothetical protein
VARLDSAALEFPGPLWEILRSWFSLLPQYVRGLSLCAEVCLYSRWAEEKRRAGPSAAEFEAVLHRLESFQREMAALAEDVGHPHQRIMLLDHRRVADVHREGVAALRQCRPRTPGRRPKKPTPRTVKAARVRRK